MKRLRVEQNRGEVVCAYSIGVGVLAKLMLDPPQPTSKPGCLAVRHCGDNKCGQAICDVH
jgi:hypothetical protein